MIVGGPKKQWLAIECLWELSQAEKVIPAQVESVVSLATWLAMMSRGLLSVLDQTYHWVRGHRSSDRLLSLPQEVRRELAALSSLLPLVGQRWDAHWMRTAFMFDASDWGSGVCETDASFEELRSEAQWAVRGGWLTYREDLGLTEKWLADAVRNLPDPNQNPPFGVSIPPQIG